MLELFRKSEGDVVLMFVSTGQKIAIITYTRLLQSMILRRILPLDFIV